MRETLNERVGNYRRKELINRAASLELKIPWFEKMCPMCKTFVSKEPMWTYIGYVHGVLGGSSGNVRMWYCTECFTTENDIIEYLRTGGIRKEQSNG